MTDMDPRPEGVYTKWETYPTEGAPDSRRIITIEQVHGNGSVSTLTLETSDAIVVARSVWRAAIAYDASGVA